MLKLLALLAVAATENPHLAKGIAQLEALDEKGALESLEKALVWPGNTSRDLATIHLHLGLARAGLGRPDEALESFRTAVDLAPALTLPPNASPKVRELWQRAGGRGAAEPSDLKAASGPAEPFVIVKPVEVLVEAKPRWPRIVGTVASVAGAASVGVGLFFAVRGNASYERARSATHAADLTREWEAAVSDHQMANRLLIPGVAVLVLGAALLIVSFVGG